jgi:hypothetical protein
MLILKREPAWWAAFASALIMNVSAFWLHLTVTQQGVLNGLVLAILGVAVALMTHDGWFAAALGFIKAILAVGFAFGLHWSPEQQSVVMTLLTTLAAGYTRTQAFAPVPPPPN